MNITAASILAWLLAHWLMLIAVITVVEQGLTRAAPVVAGWGWVRVAHAMAGFAELTPSVVSFIARLLAAGTGKPFPVTDSAGAAIGAPIAAKRATPPLAVLMLLAFAATSCAGANLASMFAGWQVTVNLGLTSASDAIPTLEGAINSSTRLTAAQKADDIQILNSIRANAIPRAEHDVAAYAQLHGLSQQCQAHASIDLVAGDFTSIIATLDAAGEQVPALVGAAIGAVAAYADSLLPACVDAPSGSPAPVMASRAQSAYARLRAALAHQGALR